MSKWDRARQKELDIKAAVRARDGYRCRKCGMTEEENLQKTGKGLEVHRIFPGCDYAEEVCAALCKSCHARMPKSIDDAYYFHDPEESGLLLVPWNLFNEKDRVAFSIIKQIAQAKNVHVETLVKWIVRSYCLEVPPDYTI